MARSPWVDVVDLPAYLRAAQAAESPEHHVRKATRLEAENQHVLDMLAQTGGDKQEAARMLGVSRATPMASAQAGAARPGAVNSAATAECRHPPPTGFA